MLRTASAYHGELESTMHVIVPTGLLLSTGGEFAFVAFGEAVSKGVLPAALTSELYMVVALSMAVVPYLAALGGKLGVLFEKGGEYSLTFGQWHLEKLICLVVDAG